MNKSVKRLSAFLAVLMMSSAFAASVSAADNTFIKVKNSDSESVLDEAEGSGVKVVKNSTAAIVDEAEEDTDEVTAPVFKNNGWIKPESGTLSAANTGYVSNINNIFVKKTSTANKIYKNEKPCTIEGGKYYSKKDAEKELASYFDSHTYEVSMYEGDERIICEDVYFVSSDNDVVYYDYSADRLVANDSGSAYVYVYTKGGVPFFRLDVNVVNKTVGRYSTIDLIPDEWHLDGNGDTTTFTIVTDGNYDADDFELSIEHGKKIASITKEGRLKVTGNGPIIVRASLKDNANVYGETLLYAGQYISSFYDGYYTYSGNKYVTNYWGYDIADVRDCYINGWIKSKEGIFVPVLKKSTGTVVKADGTEKDTTIVSYGNVSVADLIRDAYGDKDDLYDIIDKYNLFKGKDYKKNLVTYDDFDYIKYILSQAYDWCD